MGAPVSNSATSDTLEPLSLPKESVLSESIPTLVEEIAAPAVNRTQIPVGELIQILSLTDLTTLLPTDTAQKIGELAGRVLKLQQLVPEVLPLAAICVPGDTALPAKRVLQHSPTKVATVVNFPLGQSPLSTVLDETSVRLEEGVDEIDFVFPVGRYLSGETATELVNYVLEVKKVCVSYGKPLKTIIQSDELEVGKEPYDKEVLQNIEKLAAIAYSGCSDMVKTSTGKGAGSGASLQAAAVISQVARYYQDNTDYTNRMGHIPGVKFSGGIRDGATASGYIAIHSHLLGSDAVTPTTFRFGASGLVSEVIGKMAASSEALREKLEAVGVNKSYFSIPSGY